MGMQCIAFFAVILHRTLNSCTVFVIYHVYTTQPVVKTVVKWQPVWQPCWMNSHCSFNRVERTATVRSTGCQTCLKPVWQQVISC